MCGRTTQNIPTVFQSPVEDEEQFSLLVIIMPCLDTQQQIDTMGGQRHTETDRNRDTDMDRDTVKEQVCHLLLTTAVMWVVYDNALCI